MSQVLRFGTSPLPGNGRRVLLVDDDPVQARLVHAQLEDVGFSVEVAGGPNAALEMLRTSCPDAVVSDVLMDELDGFSLCRLIRQDPLLAKVPVVLLSSYFDEAGDQALAREVGASALVERSPGLESGIEALLKSLDERAGEHLEATAASSLYAHRMTHQMARLHSATMAAEARYRALFEHANDVITVSTPEGVIVEANRHTEALLQVEPGEAAGRTLGEFAAPGHEAVNHEAYREIVARDAARTAPLSLVRRDGTVVELEFTTRRLEIDGRTNILSVGRDVTELVAARRQVEASERRYRTLVENVPDVIWSATKDMKLTFLSANVARLCGFTASEIIDGAHGGEFSRVHADDLHRFRAALEALVTRRAPLDIQYRWLHPDGRVLSIHSRAALARSPDGEECIDGILANVTERKLLEEQVCRVQKVEAIGQLTAGIAHDFNNILAVVMANAEFLVETHPGEGDTAQVARDMRSAAQRGLALTSRLLAFSRRESPEPSALDLNGVVEDVERLLSRTIGKDVDLSVVRAPDLGLVCADSGQIEQVLMNLAVNARDAMPSGGALILSTANVDVNGSEDTDRDLPAPGRYVMISVKDTGGGMDTITVDRIFEPFFTTKEKGRGTGLGLSISYGIVRRCGGHFAVDSALGVGTTFRIYLPRFEPASVAESASA